MILQARECVCGLGAALALVSPMKFCCGFKRYQYTSILNVSTEYAVAQIDWEQTQPVRTDREVGDLRLHNCMAAAEI